MSLLEDLLSNQPVPGYDGVLAHRHGAVTRVVKMLRTMRPTNMVETGCQSGNLVHAQGVSTTIYGLLAQELDAKMWSVDISAEKVELCRSHIAGIADKVEVVQACSVEFLTTFGRPIDFLYLDSYDFYAGVEEESRQHCLREVLAAWQWLHRGTLVLIDDCNVQQWFGHSLNDEDIQGKSFYAHRYLMANGAACLLDFPAYQRMYIL